MKRIDLLAVFTGVVCARFASVLLMAVAALAVALWRAL